MLASNDSVLESERQKIVQQLLPLVIIMSILGLIGLIGNTSAFIFFMFKCKTTSTFVLIAILAVADFCVCVMIFPIVADMIYNVANRLSVLCKLTAFFSLWTVFFSTLILTIIAIDRHRKIWAPFQWQITMKSAIIISLCGGMLSGLWTMRSLIMFNNFELKLGGGNTTFVGNYCKFNEKLATVATVFSFGDFLLIVVELIIIAVCYSMILFVIWRQSNLMKELKMRRNDNHMQQSFDTENETALNGPSDTENITSVNTYSIDIIESKTAENVHSSNALPANEQTGQSIPTEKKKTNSGKKPGHKKRITTSEQEKRVVFMMMTVTVFFLICFFPFLAVQIVNRSDKSEFELAIGIQVVHKLPFLNSVINPFVYIVFNAKYRQFLTPRWFNFNWI